MPFFKRSKQPSPGGIIGFFGLADWWMREFTDEEQEHIQESSRDDNLVEGKITYNSGTPAQLLSGLATNFYKPEDRVIARRILSKAAELAKASGDVLDLHFTYLGMIKSYYRARDTDPEALGLAIDACEKQIALAPKAADAFRREYPEQPLPAHTGYHQLAVIRDKQKDYHAAIELSEAALRQEWMGDWENRIARNEKRLAKSSSVLESAPPGQLGG